MEYEKNIYIILKLAKNLHIIKDSQSCLEYTDSKQMKINGYIILFNIILSLQMVFKKV